MADPRPGPHGAAGRRHRHQQRVCRAARSDRVATVPAHGGRRTGDRSESAGRRPSTRRPAQGGAPRESDRDDRGVHRGGPPSCRGGLGGCRQPVRSSGAGDDGSIGRSGRASPSYRSRWDRGRHIPGRRNERPGRRRPGRHHPGDARGRKAGCAGRGAVPMCDPGDSAAAGARTVPARECPGNRSRYRPSGRVPSQR